jgi:hypothetical protein
MKALIIKDLALTAELDRSAMAAVHGGRLALPRGFYFDYSKVIKADVAVSQGVGQEQNINVVTGSNVAFPVKSDPSSYVFATQDADNDSTIRIG